MNGGYPLQAISQCTIGYTGPVDKKALRIASGFEGNGYALFGSNSQLHDTHRRMSSFGGVAYRKALGPAMTDARQF